MDESVSQNRADGNGIHLLDIFVILASRSCLIVFTSVAVTVLSYLYFFCSPNTYQAKARLLPPQQNTTLSAQILNNLRGGVTPGVGSGGGGIGGAAAGLLGFQSSTNQYIGMLWCNSLLDSIIDRFNLIKFYRVKYYEQARKKLNDYVIINMGKLDNIISIEVTAKDAKMAAEMANAFIEELDKLLQRLALEEAKGRQAFLEKERVQAMHNLTKAEESLRTFSEKNSVLQIDAQTKGVIEYIAKLRAEIDAKEVQIQVLRQQATPFNYDVVRLDTEIKGLKDKLRAAESQYENCLSDVCLPSSKAPSIGLEYLRLFREVKFQESLYRLYEQLVEIARMDLARNFAVIQVLDPAMPPEMRSNQRLSPAILVGFLTFFIMIFIVLGQEYWQQFMKNEDNEKGVTAIRNYMNVWPKIINFWHKN
jgi:capsule polysaccharide export protein KpsE/RkpR